LPYLHKSFLRGLSFRSLSKIFFWILVADFLILTLIGREPVEEPYIFIGQVASVLYFALFLIILPLIGKLENGLLFKKITTQKTNVKF
jgi:ubiquinol-cytochrome c reductase cytochrome b subunit